MKERLAMTVGPVGLEAESFVKGINVLQQKSLLSSLLPEGSWTSDAGIDQLELLNPKPLPDYRQAISELIDMETCLPPEWKVAWQARQPGYQPGDEIVWADKVRYKKMLEVLSLESPASWEKVLQMATWSALHVNVGISPWSPEGMLIMNVLNNVGPYIGHCLRHEFPGSIGHLSMWSGWARPERLPQPTDWWATPEDFGKAFGSIPSLLKGNGKDGQDWEVDLVSLQTPLSSSDLGSWWKLVRPKKDPFGNYYLEARLLPSMPLNRLDHYVGPLLDGVAAIRNWSVENGSKWYSRPQDVVPVFRAAAKASSLFPDYFLSPIYWHEFFKA